MDKENIIEQSLDIFETTFNRSHESITAEFKRDVLKSHLEDSMAGKGHLCFVYIMDEEDSKVVGVCLYNGAHPYYTDEVSQAHIITLAMHDEYRYKDPADQLLQMVLADIESKGVRSVIFASTTSIDDSKLNRVFNMFMARNGFKPIPDSKVFNIILGD